MRDRLVEMKKTHANEDDRVKTCWQTLFKLCANVANNPTEDKFRRIKLTNAAIQQRVTSLTGAVEFLELCGFQKDADGESMVMPEDKVNPLLLQAAGEQLHSAMNNPFFGIL